MNVIAVMPAYEEAPRIAPAVRAVLQVVDAVIVVDDGSKDDTATRATEAGAWTLRHSINRGQGAALKTGTQAALRQGAGIVVHIDADGQHDAQDLPRLIALVQDGSAEVVFGSRFLETRSEGMPSLRRAVLRAGRVFNTHALGISRQVTDAQSGLRVFHRSACERLVFFQDGRAHASEILHKVTTSDLRWCEQAIRVRYTPETLAKGNKTFHALQIVWHLFLSVFHRDV